MSESQVIANQTRGRFVPLNAVSSGTKEVRELLERSGGQTTVGRWNLASIDPSGGANYGTSTPRSMTTRRRAGGRGRAPA